MNIRRAFRRGRSIWAHALSHMGGRLPLMTTAGRLCASLNGQIQANVQTWTISWE